MQATKPHADTWTVNGPKIRRQTGSPNMDFTQRTAQENVWTSFGNTAATSLITISVKTSYEITSRNVASVRRSVGRNSRNFSVRPGSLPACNSPATAGGTGTKNEV